MASFELQLTENAKRVLAARYLKRGDDGRIVESPEQLFRRVARRVASAEAHFAGPDNVQHWEEAFLQVLCELDFLPNSPTLMNAGMPLGQLSACFVLPVEDSMHGIFDSLKLMALVQQSGGGTGFSFSHLRPRGTVVHSTGGTASGPVSFMRIFDCATENIRQGGKRRGANMGVLRVDHPDIEEFVDAKLDGTSFRNFNLSVGATDEFMRAVAEDAHIPLRWRQVGPSTGTIAARPLMERIALAAWKTGDPGLIFLDAINRGNPIPACGPIEATNPCGEVPLLPFEACNLGSINLSHMLRGERSEYAIDWEKLRQTTRIAVRFLDNVIEVGRWPSTAITDAVRASRKIGLGVMGFADALLALRVPYDSEQAVSLAGELMQFIADEAAIASAELAGQRGVFPHWDRSIYAESGKRLRNATRTSIAPTGTIGIIAGTSASIEPLFALAYRREHVLEDETMIELNPLFERYARREGFFSPELVRQLAAQGTLHKLAGVPAEAKRLFRTALEISAAGHLGIQAAFQNYVDNAVSKTINLPETATPADIAEIYHRAWELGLKGVTVYRYGSKAEQTLKLGIGETWEEHEHLATCDPYACKL
jgi:ribonucleoside-diphosphate reductase alpha chain